MTTKNTNTALAQNITTTTGDDDPHNWKPWVGRVCANWQNAAESVIEIGRILNEHEDQLDLLIEGRYVVRSALPFSHRTAQRLMAIARNPILSNATHVSRLPRSWGTLYELTRLSPEILEAKIEDGSINPEMERKDVAKLVPGAVRAVSHEAKMAAKHKAKMTPILKLKEENEELQRKQADLEERLAGAEVGEPVIAITTFEKQTFEQQTAETLANLIIYLAGDDKAKAIAACIMKHFKKKPGRPAKADRAEALLPPDTITENSPSVERG
jgi:hypothetical protein